MARIATIAALAALLLSASAARAQRADRGDQVDRQRALDLLDESAVLYREGRFAEAAERLRRAHALHPEPSLLYNLGRALEALGEAEGAADAYARYLEADPESPRRGEVSSRIERLRAEVPQEDGAQGPVEQGQGDGPGPEPGPEQPEPDDDGDSDGPGPILKPLLMSAVGGVVIAGVLGGIALLRHDEADSAASHRETRRLDDQARDFATAANVAFAVSGGLVVVGALVWILSDPAPETPGDGVRVDVGAGVLRVRGHF